MAIAERELRSSSDTVRPYRWTREQFYQMGNSGLLRERRIELVEGEIIQLPLNRDVHFYHRNETVASLSRPELIMRVADLLP